MLEIRNLDENGFSHDLDMIADSRKRDLEYCCDRDMAFEKRTITE
jgi:hypothetical protein